MNWTIRNTKNASVASSFGRISGQNVSTMPSRWKIVYCGISTACVGSMIVASMNANSGPRSRNRRRANAYPASEQLRTLAAAHPAETRIELTKNRHTGTPARSPAR